MHTYGGDVFEGNLIKTFIEEFIKAGGEVNLYAPGVIASMGMPIAVSCSKRYISTNGFGMIHAPQGGGNGTARDHEQTAKLLRSIEKQFIAQLIVLTGKTEQEALEWMDGTDYWLDANELVALKLFDGIIPSTVTDITTLDKEEVETLGAKGAFEKFAALTQPIDNSKISEMDKKSLIARYGLTTVTDASTDEEIMAAIDAKINAQKTEADNAKAELAKTQKTAIEAAVDAAITAGKISKEKREEYVARGEKFGLEELNAILADMQVYESVSDKLNGGGTPPKADRKDWNWEKWQKEDSAGLEALAKSDSKAFNALYKAEFGCNPE
jgi:hypothetical protein